MTWLRAITRTLLGSATGWLKRDLGWFALLSLGIAAAAFYVDARRTRADRDAWVAWVRETCALAQASPDAATVQLPDAAGKRHAVARPRGAICRQAVADLADFHTQTLANTAATLAAADRQRADRSAADLVTANRQSTARAAANHEWENTNDHIADDRVGGDWFAALNRVAGLHPNRP